MTQPVITIRSDAPIEKAWRLMQSRRIRHIPVVDDRKRLVGIVTDRDLRQVVFDPSAHGAPRGPAVEQVMTRGVITVSPESTIADAARLMHERKIGALPVVAEDRVVGIISEIDAIRLLVDVLGEHAIPRALRWALALHRDRETGDAERFAG